eukprot:64401_1
MSFSNIFVKLNCSLKFDGYIPKPHPENSDVVIISTGFIEDNDLVNEGIYEYNLTKNTFNEIYAYKQGFEPDCHGQFIDSKNELLYIFGLGTFGIFDLNTNVMNANTKN